MSYITEHPDYPRDDAAVLLLIGLGLTDESWHNDACPCFTVPGHDDLRIWCDYPDPDMRTDDGWGSRFDVVQGTTEAPNARATSGPSGATARPQRPVAPWSATARPAVRTAPSARWWPRSESLGTPTRCTAMAD